VLSTRRLSEASERMDTCPSLPKEYMIGRSKGKNRHREALRVVDRNKILTSADEEQAVYLVAFHFHCAQFLVLVPDM